MQVVEPSTTVTVQRELPAPSTCFHEVRIKEEPNDNLNGNSGEKESKINPTVKKSFTAKEIGIQLLFASAKGDLVFLRRAFMKV